MTDIASPARVIALGPTLGVSISSTESTPKFITRLACMLYEGLLLLAVLFFVAFIFLALTQAFKVPKLVFQIYLSLAVAGYFIWFWTHGGETLAMKTWRIRLVTTDGSTLSLWQALRRVALASLSLGLCGLGIIWALFDKDRQFWHDHMGGTRLIRVHKR